MPLGMTLLMRIAASMNGLILAYLLSRRLPTKFPWKDMRQCCDASQITRLTEHYSCLYDVSYK